MHINVHIGVTGFMASVHNLVAKAGEQLNEIAITKMMWLLLLIASKKILINKFIGKLSGARRIHIALGKGGEVGTVVIKRVGLVPRRDIENVHQIHARATTKKNVFVIHENVSLNGPLGHLLVLVQSQGRK